MVFLDRSRSRVSFVHGSQIFRGCTGSVVRKRRIMCQFIIPSHRDYRLSLGGATEYLATELSISGEYIVRLLLFQVLSPIERHMLGKPTPSGRKCIMVYPINPIKKTNMKKEDLNTLNRTANYSLAHSLTHPPTQLLNRAHRPFFFCFSLSPWCKCSYPSSRTLCLPTTVKNT